MSYPLEERIKNLEQAVQLLEQQRYITHPDPDPIRHGVVRAVTQVGAGTSFCGTLGAYLEVCPIPPFNTSSVNPKIGNGSLVFSSLSNYPLDGIDDQTGFIKVWSINIDPANLALFYRPGDPVKFWKYTGTAQTIGKWRGETDYAQTIRNSWVTHLDNPWFYASIKYKDDLTPGETDSGGDGTEIIISNSDQAKSLGTSSSTSGGGTTDDDGLDASVTLHRYTFTALSFDSSGDDLTGHWSTFHPCPTGSRSTSIFSDDCFSVSDYIGSTADPVPDGSVVKVYQYTTTYDGTDINYEYWFDPASAKLPTGEYQYMVYCMVSQNQAGFDYVRAHPSSP